MKSHSVVSGEHEFWGDTIQTNLPSMAFCNFQVNSFGIFFSYGQGGNILLGVHLSQILTGKKEKRKHFINCNLSMKV